MVFLVSLQKLARLGLSHDVFRLFPNPACSVHTSRTHPLPDVSIEPRSQAGFLSGSLGWGSSRALGHLGGAHRPVPPSRNLGFARRALLSAMI